MGTIGSLDVEAAGVSLVRPKDEGERWVKLTLVTMGLWAAMFVTMAVIPSFWLYFADGTLKWTGTFSIPYGFGELDELVLAYATTVHKSQGSEYPAVVIPVTTQHYPMLQRNLVYTAVTRGKRLVVLVGQKKALSIAVRGQQTRRRWSKLKEWLAERLG